MLKTLKGGKIAKMISGLVLAASSLLYPLKSEAAGRIDMFNWPKDSATISGNYVRFVENGGYGSYLPNFGDSLETYYEKDATHKYGATGVNLSTSTVYTCPFVYQGVIPDGTTNSVAFKIVTSFPSNTLVTASIEMDNGYTNFVNDVIKYTQQNSNSLGYAFVDITPNITNAVDGQQYGKVVMRFAPLENIVASAGSNGSISPAGSVLVPYGDGTNWNIQANPNHHISSITTNGATAFTNNDNSIVQTNFTWNGIVIPSNTISAAFDINKYNIITAQPTNGTMNPAGTNQVNHGGSLDYILLANEGHELDWVKTNGVYVPGKTGGQSNNFTWADIQGDGTLDASFKKLQYTIATSNGPNGTIDPLGPINWDENTNTWVKSNPFYNIDWVKKNGIYVPEAADQDEYNVQFSNVTNNQTLDASFKVKTSAKGTPYTWLNQAVGATNNFNQAELDDNDSDGRKNWEEYQSGTDPTNSYSVLQPVTIASGSNIEVVVNCSSIEDYTSPDSIYSLHKKTDLTELDWTEITNSAGKGNQKLVFIPDTAGSVGFYRVKARRNE